MMWIFKYSVYILLQYFHQVLTGTKCYQLLIINDFFVNTLTSQSAYKVGLNKEKVFRTTIPPQASEGILNIAWQLS